MQSKKGSLIEITGGLIFGLFLSIFIVQPIVFGMFGVDFGLSGNTTIAVIFTAVSFVRSYIVRRFFNWLHKKYPNIFNEKVANEMDK